MRWLLLACVLVGCGGEAADVEAVEAEELLTCGALPDLSQCRESKPEFFGSEEDPAVLCDGWPENPFGETEHLEEFFQVVYEGGSRGIVSRVNGQTVCKDRWME